MTGAAAAALGALLLVASSSPGAVARDGTPAGAIPWETVTGTEASEGYAWTSGYDVRVDEDVVRVRLGIRLLPAPGVTRPELERAMPAWERGIEETWGRRFALEEPGRAPRPIVVEVDFRGPRFHHEVVVRPGRGRTDQLDWHLADTPAVVAHEAGHMLGALDDYRGGAAGPSARTDDPGSVMAADPGRGTAARARHWEGFRARFAARAGTGVRVLDSARDEEASAALGGGKRGRR